MAKQSARTATPRLRFPEFRNGSPWRTYLLEELEVLAWIELGRGNVISNQDIQKIPGNFPIYSSSVKNDGYMGSYGRFMFDEELISWSIDGGGDFFYRPKHKFSVTNVSGYMRLVADHLNYRFTATQLQSLHSSQVFDYQLKAHPSVIRKLYRLAVPDKAEQQKIADCLTSLDEVIAAQGRKVETLKAHKRGLMQQLFPREGETRPRLRFPEFRDAPEWIARRLGDLMVIGSSRRVHESDWTTEGVPFYRAREIVALGKGESIEPLFISETLYEEFTGFTGQIEAGQLLVTGVGSIGIPYLVKRDDRFYFKDGNIIWFKNDQSDISGDFLYRLFESVSVQAQIATMAGIGTVGTYTIENARRTVAVFPEDMREQQRIADCLSSLDNQITAESNRLAALKTHKQGLMQQLFPAPEATGA